MILNWRTKHEISRDRNMGWRFRKYHKVDIEMNVFINMWSGFYFNRMKVLFTVCSCHVTYAFQSESTLYSCLNVKELLAQNRREILIFSDCNETRTHNHLIRKRTLNHLRTKCLWVQVPLQSLKNILPW